MDLFKWLKFKKRQPITITVRQSKNDRWRWSMYVGSELYAICPIYGFKDYATAKANALAFLKHASKGEYVLTDLE